MSDEQARTELVQALYLLEKWCWADGHDVYPVPPKKRWSMERCHDKTAEFLQRHAAKEGE